MTTDDEVLTFAQSRVGRVLKGKYRLDRVLGVGGMAAVYIATHRNKKEFAIKMLHPELSIRENIRTRFLREGYAANSVKHPGSVAVMDDDVAEDGSAFLVMELLEGSTVEDLCIPHGGRLPVVTVLHLADQLLDVLASAHTNGIVHRDLKPPNLFVTREGVLKVLDFGIARVRDAATGGAGTQTGALLGTPAYVAPEQALGKASEIDAQTDLWSVGATFFVLLSGQLVHEGDNAQQLMIAAATRPARGLATVAPDVPAQVAAIVDKALAFEKKDRWASAAAMREAVQRAHLELFGSPIASPGYSSAPILSQPLLSMRRSVPNASSSPAFDATQAAPEVPVSAGPGPSAVVRPVPAAPRLSTTVGVEGDQAPREARKAKWVWPVIVAASIAVGGLATVALQRARLGAPPGAAAATPVGLVSPALSATEPAPAPSTPSAPTAPSAVPSAAASDAPALSVLAPAPAGGKPRGKPAHAVAPPPPPAASAVPVATPSPPPAKPATPAHAPTDDNPLEIPIK